MILTQSCLTLDLARHCLNATLQKASELNVRVSIAIVDVGGNLIHMAHMDGAPLQSRDIALNKALTAVGFGISTSQWQSRLERCSTAVQRGLPAQPTIALFGGGEPFRLTSQVIGAIGVSGASEAIDCECALAAIARATELLDLEQ
ncbi:GlcG/HbpS family heme-binding protein [Pseudomonas syringae]|uniref:GlcG/HbpS family heme-binding protein n=1 Tax=Pseudomonas syringae TaxID=317 RepID=UPI001F45B719|nr:heme-binding protein [Pseudomonas syringae]